MPLLQHCDGNGMACRRSLPTLRWRSRGNWRRNDGLGLNRENQVSIPQTKNAGEQGGQPERRIPAFFHCSRSLAAARVTLVVNCQISARILGSQTCMWWRRQNLGVSAINPYLGVGYTVPEHWSAQNQDAAGGIQFLPPVSHSAYRAAILLRVFPDMQNMSPQFAGPARTLGW